jgi:hypothetical protein
MFAVMNQSFSSVMAFSHLKNTVRSQNIIYQRVMLKDSERNHHSIAIIRVSATYPLGPLG